MLRSFVTPIAFPSELQSVCTAVMKEAQSVQTVEEMPSMDPNKVLLVHYSRGKNVRPQIFWHKDDAASDGTADHPVVSVSVGESCTFKVCHKWSYQRYKAIVEAGEMHDIKLESGDAILMGGPARMMHHSVTSVHKGTCPEELKSILGDARINVTFRDAPDINVNEYKMFNV